jgi:hypothetical protein
VRKIERNVLSAQHRHDNHLIRFVCHVSYSKG